MSALRWTRLSFKPVASCQNCNWHTTYDATRAAKRHATTNPGHTVITEKVERGEYWMPTEEAP